MAYETGSATSLGDLLVRLFDFASLNGWTINEDISSDIQVPPQGAISRNGYTCAFYFNSEYLKMYPSIGFTAASDPGDHPESAFNDTLTTFPSANSAAPTNVLAVNGFSGAVPSYHFFGGSDHLYVVAEVRSGVFRHFGISEIVKFGDWAGGYYFHNTYNGSGAVTVNSSAPHPAHGGTLVGGSSVLYGHKNNGASLSGATVNMVADGGRWWRLTNSDITPIDDASGNEIGNLCCLTGLPDGLTSSLFNQSAGVSSFNGFRPMVPATFATLNRDSTPFNTHILGSMPSFRLTTIQDLSNGQVITIGSDDWILFPVMSQRDYDASVEWSGKIALAYKRVI